MLENEGSRFKRQITWVRMVKLGISEWGPDWSSQLDVINGAFFNVPQLEGYSKSADLFV
jgi:hypothetical protein